MAEANSTLVGQRFTRLLVIESAGQGKHGRSLWLCKCDCGNTRVISTGDLNAKKRMSCGCLRNEMVSERRRTHGLSTSSEYKIWERMVSRCHNPDDAAFDRYGARGITVCDRWRTSFETFLADVGTRPSDSHSMDRYPNNDGNYEPANCRWATDTQQGRNKRNNNLLTHDGKTLSVSEWAEILGITREMIRGRLNRGWDVGRSLTTKPDRRRQPNYKN